MHSPHHKGITDAIPEIIKGICHVTLSNSDDKGLHQISFHLLAVQQVNVGNKGEVLTVLNEDRNKLKIQKLFLRMELLSSFLLFLFSFCLSSCLLPPPSLHLLFSHHSKMLPGPVLVVMVTKTGGDSHVTGSP